MRFFGVGILKRNVLSATRNKKDLLDVGALKGDSIQVTGDEAAMKKIGVAEIDVLKIASVKVALDNSGPPKRGVSKPRGGEDAVLQVGLPKGDRRYIGVIEEAELKRAPGKVALCNDGGTKVTRDELFIGKRETREGCVGKVEVQKVIAFGQEIVYLRRKRFPVRGVEETVVSVEDPGAAAFRVLADYEGKHTSA